jgi:protein-disulfide isomerase
LYSDFECPFCKKFGSEVWPVLREKYVQSGQLLVVFRQLPIEQLHPKAVRAAAGAVCAGLQGKFWEMHDLLFGKRFEDGDLAKHSTTLGLEPVRFDRCLTKEGPAIVERDREEARELGITGTPTTFIGALDADGMMLPKVRVSGARPLQEFDTALQRFVQASVPER